jgi:perosamine synthetase
MDNKIYMAGASVGELEERYVLDALRNGWYEQKYYYCEKLQSDFAQYHGRKYALMTSNCTTAIHLLLKALDIKAGDEVIVPECTWIASMVSSVHLGATPVFCDIQSDTWCLDPEALRRAITKKTKAVICVDLFGNMAEWDAIQAICDENSLYLVEDSAEALGSTYKGRKAGSFGIGSVFSFHNTKTMTTGEGGMLLLDDDDLYQKCVKLRDLGRGPETKPYFNEIVGYKFMPFNMQAALGLAQFQRLDELVAIRRHHFEFYKSRLGKHDVTFNHEREGDINSVWITGMVMDKRYGLTKEKMMDELSKLGIPSRPFFYPLSSLPAFDLSHRFSSINPTSYDISNRGINLPGAANLTDEQLDLICNKIALVLDYYS